MTALSWCRQSLRRVALALPVFGRGIRCLSSGDSRARWEIGSVHIWNPPGQCHARFRLLRPGSLRYQLGGFFQTRHLIGVEVRGTIQRRFNHPAPGVGPCRASNSTALWAVLLPTYPCLVAPGMGGGT